MTSCVRNIFVKNDQNLIIGFQVTVIIFCRGCFFETQCIYTVFRKKGTHFFIIHSNGDQFTQNFLPVVAKNINSKYVI